jgi:two-component system, sensor histidine kinase PdtaS
MDSFAVLSDAPAPVRAHLANLGDNLQLLADLGYGYVALCVPGREGALGVVADARPNTAVSPVATSRAGVRLARKADPEAYAALARGEAVVGEPRRAAGDIAFVTTAFPVGQPLPYAVVTRGLAEQVTAAPGRMETAFMEAAVDLLNVLRDGPLIDVRTHDPFAATRHAGVGVLRVARTGRVSFASPNAVTIMRMAGAEGRITGAHASELPGGGHGISPLLGIRGALAVDLDVAGRVLGYRSVALPAGVLVLIEDLTEARRREQEIVVKDAIVREVHHRVKNNLQTIASLLRMQARRSDSDEARKALTEAVERAAAMAAVHDLLSRSDHERVDFAEAARTVVELVRRGLMGDDTRIAVRVTGSTGEIDASSATSLALVLAELVHNALEHAFAPQGAGKVDVILERTAGELVVKVCDDGRGLPVPLDPVYSPSLGFSIVRSLVEEDLRGTLAATGGDGTCVTIRVPMSDTE